MNPKDHPLLSLIGQDLLPVNTNHRNYIKKFIKAGGFLLLEVGDGKYKFVSVWRSSPSQHVTIQKSESPSDVIRFEAVVKRSSTFFSGLSSWMGNLPLTSLIRPKKDLQVLS